MPCRGNGNQKRIATFKVRLTKVKGARTARGEATGYIEPHLSLILGHSTVVEPPPGQQVVAAVTARLAAAVDVPVTFRWGAGVLRGLDHPAEPGTDFVETLAYATIPAGRTSVDLPVTTLGDARSERDEQVAVLVDPHSTLVPVLNQGSLTILDNGRNDGSTQPPPTVTPTVPPPTAGPTSTTTPRPTVPPRDPGQPPVVTGTRAGSVVDYLAMPGDQAVTVPNGTYRGGTSTVDRPATNGPYKGWLVLVAQSQGGVVVDLSAAPLTLAANAGRVMFVGFRFVNGTVSVEGHDVAFWYTDHTFPASTCGARTTACTARPDHSTSTTTRRGTSRCTASTCTTRRRCCAGAVRRASTSPARVCTTPRRPSSGTTTRSRHAVVPPTSRSTTARCTAASCSPTVSRTSHRRTR